MNDYVFVIQAYKTELGYRLVVEIDQRLFIGIHTTLLSALTELLIQLRREGVSTGRYGDLRLIKQGF